jgi:hypothetical protein
LEAAANSCFNLKGRKKERMKEGKEERNKEREKGRKKERKRERKEGGREGGREGRKEGGNLGIRDIVELSMEALRKTQQDPTSPGTHLGFTLVRL